MKFIYESYSISDQTLTFKYSVDKFVFTHQVIYENLQIPLNPDLAFHLGLAEMFSYWKLTCAPEIEVKAGSLTPDQISFWHKLLINGMGQYFYENKIDFTKPNFVTIKNSSVDKFARRPDAFRQSEHEFTTDEILIPIGGGKDSIVTYELLKNHCPVKPIIVYPASPASLRYTPDALAVRRILDPQILQPNFLKGHVPYSAILGFIFLLTQPKYIIVSNERSSDEGNVAYLGHQINHQYSKSLEFETDFNSYLKDLKSNISYFSFLRPLYELQIAKIFSHYPLYFGAFRSCNRNQQLDSWCGHCPKCLSIAMTLRPWTSDEVIHTIFGFNPLTDSSNQSLLSELTDPTKTKPFECVTTLEEANICLEFIKFGQTERVKEFLSRWGPSPNTPPEFIKLLHDAYYT